MIVQIVCYDLIYLLYYFAEDHAEELEELVVRQVIQLNAQQRRASLAENEEVASKNFKFNKTNLIVGL